MAYDGPIRRGWIRVGIAEQSATETAISATPPRDRSMRQGTFISSGANFEGTLSLTGDIQIDTEFRGELETDGTMIIGPLGSVVGNIRAREVVIRGAVVGDVMASRQLILEATGILHGDIETACLEIQKRAFFKGNTSMTQPLANRRNSSPVARGTESASASG